MNKVIEVNGLEKVYKNFRLNSISFSVEENCITGFIGVNGAGKTTTIKSILGLISKDAGSIKVFGKELKGNEKVIKNRIGVVLDSGGFYDELSINEMKGIIAPSYSSWNEKEYKNYIDRFELNPKQKIETLSKGMRMKFALALALSHEADLLIMDEPTSGLDPKIRNEFMNILLEFMKKEGKSVFFSTHITSDLDKVADMLVFLDNGKIIFQQDKDILLDTHRLVKGYRKELSEEERRLFISINETDFGFSGITKDLSRVKNISKELLIEKPTIENVMLAYLEGGKKQCL